MSKINELRTEIAKKQKELAEAEDFERRLRADDPQAIAEVLHDAECRWSHVDQCSWEYETWEGKTQAGNRTRMEWVERAKKLIAAAKKQGISTGTFLKIRKQVL